MGCVWKRPRGALPATGDLLAAPLGFGECPEGALWWLWGTRGHFRGQGCADSFARLTLQHGPDLRVFKVNLVLWVLLRANQPHCVLLWQGS